MRALTIVLLLGATITATPVLALPQCAVGLHVDSAGSSRSPGVIADIDELRGSYLVRYDNSSQQDWMSSLLLARSCVGMPAGARDLAFYTGTWDDPHLSGGPDLAISSDGTYPWLIQNPSQLLQGTWYQAGGNQLSDSAIGPGIVLTNAVYGHDWVLQSQGDINPDGRVLIYAIDSEQNYYSFLR